MAISRWVFDKSIQKYLAGGFYDPDIVQVATALGRNPATCEIREFQDANPSPDPSLIYQVPIPPNPLKNLITAALADTTVPASIKAIFTTWNTQLK